MTLQGRLIVPLHRDRIDKVAQTRLGNRSGRAFDRISGSIKGAQRIARLIGLVA